MPARRSERKLKKPAALYRRAAQRVSARDTEPPCRIAFVGAECYPFVKTGGLGDVMYALPRALLSLSCEVRVLLPRYRCIPEAYRESMRFVTGFTMELCADGRSYPVGIWELERDGVSVLFLENDEFFGVGNPYTDLVRDIPRYCYFSRAALEALNVLGWAPDVIHCHDWQASLVPVYLRTLYADTPVGRAKSMLTIHNLRFQGVHNLPTVLYWSSLPYSLVDYRLLQQGYADGNMFKCGLAFADCITTVSGTYAAEIQTEECGEGLDAHLRYHAGKLHGIVNGIDTALWNSASDRLLTAPYSAEDAPEKKRENKRALQERLGLERDGACMLLAVISRLTDQKGLDLVCAALPRLLDGETQLVVLGTGEERYEEAFRRFAGEHRGRVSANILYDEALAHEIYAGADAFLVPSLFEPCGLTQLIAMRYGTVPIVRETGGLRDTVAPYCEEDGTGNGFRFARYEPQALLDAVERAKAVFFTQRGRWDEIVRRDMEKDVSWENAARQYRALYTDLTRESM